MMFWPSVLRSRNLIFLVFHEKMKNKGRPVPPINGIKMPVCSSTIQGDSLSFDDQCFLSFKWNGSLYNIHLRSVHIVTYFESTSPLPKMQLKKKIKKMLRMFWNFVKFLQGYPLKTWKSIISYIELCSPSFYCCCAYHICFRLFLLVRNFHMV